MKSNLRAVSETYSSGAAEYDRRWSRYLRATLEPTVAALPSVGRGPVLDVGCGTGLLLASLLRREPGARLVGVDATAAMLAAAHARLDDRVELVLADAASLPFHDRAFAAAATTSALHHWAEPGVALHEIRRVLAPGGALVLTDWRADHLPTRARDLAMRVSDPSHNRAYTVRGARALLESAGFEVQSAERYRLGWSWGFMTLLARAP